MRRALGIASSAITQIRRRRILALAIAASSAVVAGGAVTVVGRAIDRNEALALELSSTSARSITVTATNPDLNPIPRNLSKSLAGLPGVERAVALTAPTSIRNSRLEEADVSVGLFEFELLNGDTPLTMTTGRPLAAGEVLLADRTATTLGIAIPAIGSVTSMQRVFPTVGSYRSLGVGRISELLDGAAITPMVGTSPIGIVAVVVRTSSDVAAVSSAIIRLLAPLGPSSFVIDFDQRAASVDEVVRASGRTNTRGVAIGILSSGAFAAGLLAFLSAVSKRRDNARQRALGRTRLQLVIAAAAQTALASLVGAVLGSAVAHAMLQRTGSVAAALPIWTAVAVTAAQVLAVLPAAAFGALQDPARILRVP